MVGGGEVRKPPVFAETHENHRNPSKNYSISQNTILYLQSRPVFRHYTLRNTMHCENLLYTPTKTCENLVYLQWSHGSVLIYAAFVNVARLTDAF